MIVSWNIIQKLNFKYYIVILKPWPERREAETNQIQQEMENIIQSVSTQKNARIVKKIDKKEAWLLFL